MEKEGLKHKVFRDSLWNFSNSLISRIGGLIFTIILARILLPEGFGLYSLATSVALMFVTFADLGINQAMIRFVSLELEHSKKKAIAYFKYILKIKITISLIVSLILFVAAIPLANYVFNKPEISSLLMILSFYIFLLALESFFESLFYIKNKVKYLTLKEFLLQTLRIIAIVSVFYLVTKAHQLLGVMVGLAVSLLIVFIMVVYFIKKIFKFLFEKSEVKIDKNRVMKFIGYLTLAGLSGIFLGYIDTILLGIFVSSEYIGYYRAAFTLIFGIAGLLSFANVLLPVLTTVKKESLGNVFNKIMKYSLIITIPAAVGLIILANYTLRFVYGYEYLPAALPLYFLSPLVILLVLIGGIYSPLLSAKEKAKEFAWLTVITTILNIFLNILLIKILLVYSELWAVAGASIAALVSWTFYAIGEAHLSKRLLGIKLEMRNFVTPLLASGIMAIVLVLMQSLIGDMTLISGILEVIVGIIVYSIFLILFKGISLEEIKDILTVFKI